MYTSAHWFIPIFPLFLTSPYSPVLLMFPPSPYSPILMPFFTSSHSPVNSLQVIFSGARFTGVNGAIPSPAQEYPSSKWHIVVFPAITILLTLCVLCSSIFCPASNIPTRSFISFKMLCLKFSASPDAAARILDITSAPYAL